MSMSHLQQTPRSIYSISVTPLSICHVTHVTLFVRVGEAKGGAVGANEDELPHTICAAII